MIHTLYTMTIRRYGQLDQSDDLTLLKRWYNPFPVKWFDTQTFFSEVQNVFGGGNDNTLRDEKYRLLSYNKILMLDRILRVVGLLMKDHDSRNLFGLLLKVKVDTTSNLPYYIKKVKQLTGINIKDGKGLEQLQIEIQRLLDKHHERFAGKPVSDKVDIIDILFGVFSIMEMDYVPSMTLAEFSRLKVLSDKKIKQRNGKHK